MQELKQDSLTKEYIACYNTEGYLVLPQLLSQADMAPARTAMAQKVDAIADELYAAGRLARAAAGA
ncbi:MAG: hypothetical protein ABIV47_28110 [Roseiflexaceae bacterium]